MISMHNETITLTFGEAGKNHTGMEMIGEKAKYGEGFSKGDLKKISSNLKEYNIEHKIYNLNNLYKNVQIDLKVEDARLLVIKDGLDIIGNEKLFSDKLFEEMKTFDWDKKYYDVRRGKVLNKLSRANVCFDEVGRECDYIKGKGTIIPFNKLKYLNKLRKNLKKYFGKKAKKLICEGNHYYDLNKCGIGYHGDTERKKVIGVRLGGKMPLHFTWFNQSFPVGKTLELELDHGDLYIMSEKTVGGDWKYKNKLTLRHSAGANKYTSLQKYI